MHGSSLALAAAPSETALAKYGRRAISSPTMAYLTQAFIAIAVIAVVAIAAVSFEPANPLAPWLKLVERYATDRRPSQLTFTDVSVLFGSSRRGLKPLTDFGHFDIALDDFGLWLIYKGPLPDDCPAGIKIPGTHVRFVQQKGDQYQFDLFAEPPVRIAVPGEAGVTIQQKCQADAT